MANRRFSIARPRAPRAGAVGFRGRVAGPAVQLGVSQQHTTPGPHGGVPHPGAPARPGLGPTPTPMPTRGPGPRAQRPAAPPRPALSPPDSAYNHQIASINRAEENRLADLRGQEQGIKSDFGLEDPTNPFSRAEALKRAYLQNLRGTSASLAAQGHLYSGEHERALARVRLNQERDYAALRQAYDQALAQVTSAKAGAQTQSEEQRAQAFAEWLGRAPTDNTLPTDAPATTPSGGGAPAPQQNPHEGLGPHVGPRPVATHGPAPAPTPEPQTPTHVTGQRPVATRGPAPAPGPAQRSGRRQQQRRGRGREQGRVVGRRAIYPGR